MKPITCTESEALLMKHMDGIITSDERAQLHHHIETCHSCMEYYMEYDQAMEYSAQPTAIWQQAPDNFTSNVMAKVKAELSHAPEKIAAASPANQKTLYTTIGASSIFMGIILAIAIFAGLDANINNFIHSLQNVTFAIDGALATGALILAIIISALLVVLQNPLQNPQNHKEQATA